MKHRGSNSSMLSFIILIWALLVSFGSILLYRFVLWISLIIAGGDRWWWVTVIATLLITIPMYSLFYSIYVASGTGKHVSEETQNQVQ